MPENEYKKIFSKNLRYYMNKNNKKQSDLINDLGFSSSTMSNWCTGEKLPRMNKVQILADYFHINKSDLLEDKSTSDEEEPYYLNDDARDMSEEAQKRIFTRNLNSYIEASGKTQLEIAKSIGVSPQTFNTWCKGIAIPRMGKVQALADYFHINKSDLIEDKSNSNEDETYYLNDDARDMAQFMYENPEYKVLFDASRKVKKEDIDFVKQMIDRMSNKEG